MAKNKASQAVVWVILGLLILGLGGFGVTNFGGSVRTVGSVGGTEIDVTTYGRELQAELRALSQQTGQPIGIAEAQAFGLDRAVLGRLVSRAALDNETARLGLSVGDEAVANQVRELPAFQGVDGSFDREAYQFALENAGLTIAAFEDQVRADTARNILQSAVVGGLAVPDVYADRIYDWARERRDITWALLGAQDLTEPLSEPSETDLVSFHEENADRFTLSETKVISYAWLTPRMLLDNVETNEADLRTLYDERIDSYRRPERRLVERLVFANETEAETALGRIEAGEASFEDLVTERDLALADIDLGDVTLRDLGDAGDGVFALDGPGLAGPLPTPLGPALFRVNAILAATETSFEEARDELAAEFASDSARREIDAMVADLDDLLAAGATLEELAADTEMEFGTIEYRSDVEDGIAAHQEFRDAALVVEDGDFPELYDFEEGGLFAIRLDETRPPELQPLDAVRPDVIAGWEEAEAARLLTEQAQAGQQAIEGGAEMAGLDLPLRMERGLERTTFLDDAPAGMIENIFQMSEGDVRVFAAPGGAALVRLDMVTLPAGDDPEGEMLKATFRQQAAQQVSRDALEMFTRTLQATAGIEVNQQAINAVHAQLQ